MKKTYHYIVLSVAVLSQLLFFTACNSDESDTNVPSGPSVVETLNVDFILPPDIQASWQPAIEMAMENISASQRGLSKQVKLNLRFHDEKMPANDLQQTLYSLCVPEAGADTCHLIIGPYDIDNARKTLSTADTHRVPVVMPTVAGDEISESMPTPPTLSSSPRAMPPSAKHSSVSLARPRLNVPLSSIATTPTATRSATGSVSWPWNSKSMSSPPTYYLTVRASISPST